MFADYFYWTASACMVACLVSRQLIRERLVAALLANRHPFSSEVSSWAPSSSGFAIALKWSYVWGAKARELLALSYAKKYVVLFRTADILLLLLVVGAVGALLHEAGWLRLA
jgi:hypothetical protein